MEGRALNREPRKQWAWLAPWLSSGVASVIADVTGAERVSFFLTGLAAGLIWQLLYRRDLASRLTPMSVVVTVGVVAALTTRQELRWNDMNTVGLLAIGVLLGLIYTEQYQRWQDRTAWKRSSHLGHHSDASV